MFCLFKRLFDKLNTFREDFNYKIAVFNLSSYTFCAFEAKTSLEGAKNFSTQKKCCNFIYISLIDAL